MTETNSWFSWTSYIPLDVSGSQLQMKPNRHVWEGVCAVADASLKHMSLDKTHERTCQARADTWLPLTNFKIKLLFSSFDISGSLSAHALGTAHVVWDITPLRGLTEDTSIRVWKVEGLRWHMALPAHIVAYILLSKSRQFFCSPPLSPCTIRQLRNWT